MGGVVKSGFGAVNSLLNVAGLGVPDMPEMEDPKAAPQVDDKQRLITAEREMKRRQAGKGRAGTILSGSSKLG